MTVPVGVLQSDDFVIEPALPERVAGALSRLRMNAFEKVFLRFPSKFWDAGVYAIRQQGPEGRGGTPGTTSLLFTGRRRCSLSPPGGAPGDTRLE